MSERIIDIINESNRSTEGKDKDPIRQLYSTLIANDNLPTAVYEIEHLNLLIDTMPDDMRDVIQEIYDLHIRAVTSTRSIWGAIIKELTLQKSRVEYSGGESKSRGIAGKLFGGKGDQG